MPRYIIALIVILISIVPSLTFSAEKNSQAELKAQLMMGQNLIFARDYSEALKIFKKAQKEYPDSPGGYFGEMAVYEIQMLEREDLRLANKLEAVSVKGKEVVGKVLQRYDPTPWDLFISGALYGLDGFFKARKGMWWEAYVSGNKSRQLFRHVKKIDPKYVDADFGLGMYLYWRSVFIKDLWFLKFFPDKKAEGIAIVEGVAKNGHFSKEMAKMNLGIIYYEEKQYDDAARIFKKYVEQYPDNVVIRRLYGKVLVSQKKYVDAIKQFQTMLDVAPSLKKPHYFIGATLIIEGDKKNFPKAEKELRIFIKDQDGTYWPASAHYWLGRMREKEGNKEAAKKEYEEAYKLNPKIEDALKRARAMGGGL
ncbi:MAG: tetratricopeptide repeat protein [Deltaproteobacteria bacterium]|jgi:TolA-binding protein|nr:tetratricopeptide repeat protein [Deltaproteobacteria bacterium]